MYTISEDSGTLPNLSNFIPYEVGLGYDSLNSEFRRRLVQLPVAGRFIVSAKDEFRADLMAHNLYGDTSYWWILLDYNNLDSPEQLVVGTSLSYPSPSAILDLIYSVSKMTSQSTLGDKDVPQEENSVMNVFEVVSPSSRLLSFPAKTFSSQYIYFNDERLIDLVDISLTNGKFSLSKYKVDGVSVFRVSPMQFNYTGKKIIGSVVFTFKAKTGVLSEKVNFIQEV